MAAIKKERIKDQMVKTAARLWEIPENEIEANFDPLVLLLIEACAAELERIGYKIRESHQRLVDRLADLLVPDSATGAYPSSCVIQAQSVESQAMVTPSLGFYVQASQQGYDNVSNSTQNIELTPVGEFPVHNVQLKYYGAGNKFYRSFENGGREFLAGKDSERPSGSIWLLLSPGKTFEGLKNLQLYFHLRNISEDQQFFFGLSQAACKVNGQPVEIKQGYSTQHQFDLQPVDMLSKGHHYHQKIKRNIAANYANRFLHIAENIDANIGSLPPSLSWLPADVVKMISSEALIFLEIQLPRNFSQDLLDALSIHVNAFPVANLSLHQVQYRTSEWINIIPLPVHGSFLDLVNVSSSTGHPYHFRYAAGKRQPNEGEAILRNAGIGNTSSYEIRGMASTLMEAIRDQYAFFSEISNQSILNQLKEITILLNRLEDRIQESKDLVENKSYLLIRPIETGELVSVDYYTTQGTGIQGVKLYSKAEPKRFATIAPGTSFIISPLLGGRDSPSSSEKQLILKQQLLSRGRVVTAEDIRLICQQLFGANIKGVKVGRTTKIEPGAQSGFAMYVSVTITLAADNKLLHEELNYLSRQLEYQLAEGAIPGLPFEIVINKPLG
jgi:hypothetical protein